jgi:hypothetical protein
VENCKSRHVDVMPDHNSYQALRYNNEGEICIVAGPIKEPRRVDNERILHVASNLVLPGNCFPMICHGLVSASLFTGNLEDVRDNCANSNWVFTWWALQKQDSGAGIAKSLER